MLFFLFLPSYYMNECKNFGCSKEYFSYLLYLYFSFFQVSFLTSVSNNIRETPLNATHSYLISTILSLIYMKKINQR